MSSSFVFVTLIALALSQSCTNELVQDASTTNTPLYNAASSGITSNDTLQLVFTWPTYGDASARTIVADASGFIPLGAASGALCSHNLAAAIIANNPLIQFGAVSYGATSAPCTDSTVQQEQWSTIKSFCGNAYFASSNTSTSYDVEFLYRLTYTELLSSGLNRTVQSDYSFVVSAPTSFTAQSDVFVVAGTSTFVTEQTLTSDASGALTLQVTTISDCLNSLAVDSVIATAGTAIVGLSVTQPVEGSVLTAGPYAGLCPFVWTIPVTPTTVPGVSCNIDGTYKISYTITHADATTDAVVAMLDLTSSDTCTLVTATTLGNPSFELTLWKGSQGTIGALLPSSTVTLDSTAHWKLTVAAPVIIGVPIGTLTIDAFWVQINGGVFAQVTGQNLVDLQLQVPDGATTGTTALYDLYFSNIWTDAVFSNGGAPRTNVAIRIDFHLVYPVLKRDAAFARNKSPGYNVGTSNFEIASARALNDVSTTQPTTTTAAASVPSSSESNRAVVIAVATAGACLLLMLLITLTVIGVRWRRNRHTAVIAESANDFDGIQNVEL